jgi:hypothetical protein
MDNLSEYLPLLVLLLISIVSQVLKPKKKKPATDSSPEVETATPVQVVFPRQKRDDVKKVFNTEPKHASHSGQKFQAPQQTFVYEEELATPVFDISNSEEIKKAVIYSEILNRKF